MDHVADGTGAPSATGRRAWPGRFGSGRFTTVGQRCDNRVMGFNPHRQYKRRPSDYVLVAVSLALVLALVAWGFLG